MKRESYSQGNGDHTLFVKKVEGKISIILVYIDVFKEDIYKTFLRINVESSFISCCPCIGDNFYETDEYVL